MREIKVSNKEAGQRFDKYLKKYLSQAGSGFIYKMLRKKNITLNGKKASGNELLSEGDVVKMFFAEETFEKFTMSENDAHKTKCEINVVEKSGKRIIIYNSFSIEILYEDNNVIFMNKPAGLLSQPDNSKTVSMVEILSAYLIADADKSGGPSGFRPGICNRLDRNTSGVIAAGKTVKGLQELSEAIRKRTVKKMYVCLVEGKVTSSGELKGYLTKDEDSNKVHLSKEQVEGASYIETIYRPIQSNGVVTMLEVQLITGKTHQIRAHMASIGHPILGDKKYNSSMKSISKYQMLHAHKMIFEKMDGVLSVLSGKTIEAKMPDGYKKYFR